MHTLGRAPSFVLLENRVSQRAFLLSPLLGEQAVTARRYIQKKYFGAGMLLESQIAVISLQKYVQTHVAIAEMPPVFFSLALLASSHAERLEELSRMLQIITKHMHDRAEGWSVVVGVSDMDESTETLRECGDLCALAATFSVHCYIRFSITLSPESAADILNTPHCAGGIVTEALSWNAVTDEGKKLFFRTTTSPLTKQGGGYVRGKYLLPLVAEWIRQVCRKTGKPLIAAGCVLRPRDLVLLKESGAQGIVIDVARTLRPWNVGALVTKATNIFKQKV